MKLSDILTKSLDVITGQPQILAPYIIPFVLALLAHWRYIPNIMDWGIGRLSTLGRGPVLYYQYLIQSLQKIETLDWVLWIVFLVILAVCVALTIVMSNASLSGGNMKIGQAFDAIAGKLPIFIVAFLISWVLKFLGMFFFWVGIFIPSVILIFLGQSILLGNKDLFDSFSDSFDLAKANWIEVLILLFIFLVALAILRFLPILGTLVACLLVGYSAVVFTVLYRDRKRGPVKRPKVPSVE